MDTKTMRRWGNVGIGDGHVGKPDDSELFFMGAVFGAQCYSNCVVAPQSQRSERKLRQESLHMKLLRPHDGKQLLALGIAIAFLAYPGAIAVEADVNKAESFDFTFDVDLGINRGDNSYSGSSSSSGSGSLAWDTIIATASSSSSSSSNTDDVVVPSSFSSSSSGSVASDADTIVVPSSSLSSSTAGSIANDADPEIEFPSASNDSGSSDGADEVKFPISPPTTQPHSFPHYPHPSPAPAHTVMLPMEHERTNPPTSVETPHPTPFITPAPTPVYRDRSYDPVDTSTLSLSASASLKPSTVTPEPAATVISDDSKDEDSFEMCSGDAGGNACVKVETQSTESLEFSSEYGSTNAAQRASNIASLTSTPYTSTYCRCKEMECQNEYPGDSNSVLCTAALSNGSCPSGYQKCVETDFYKLSVTPTTPNSLANVTFSVVASDIIGAFYNLGTENPLDRGSNWWVTITLPSGWRFVLWEKTSLEVTLSGLYDEGEVSRRSQVRQCSSVTDAADCDDDTSVGFLNVMQLLEGRQGLINSSCPLSFVLLNSVVVGSDTSSSSVAIALVYEKSSGSLASTSSSTTSRRMRELAVSADSTTTEEGTLSVVSLSTMDTPTIEEGEMHSSLVWIEKDSDQLTLSFSTSTIIGTNSQDPQVCVNLRSATCASKGRESTANISFAESASAAYVKDGNPFINLYSQPGDAPLEIDGINSTYFCVKNLLPTGADTNTSWEISTDFTFQIQINGAISGDEDGGTTSASYRLPELVELVLIDRNATQGSDCAQILFHTSTSSNHELSLYSVMSVTIYSVALVAAILITRMNGVSFSGISFYNDMTSVFVVLVFLLPIIENALWIRATSDGETANSSHIYYLLRQITTCCAWTMMTSVCFHWSSVLYHDIRKIRRLYVLLAYIFVNAAFYTFELFGLISLTDFYKCTYDDYLKNPRYSKRLCNNDYCPDLQPYQWKYSTDHVCKDVAYSEWYFPIAFGGDILIFLAAIALLILGSYVLRRGSRLIEQSGDIYDERILAVMKKSLTTYLIVILGISVSLGISCVMNIILFVENWTLNPIVWYTFTIWLPTLVPPAGFLLLQWNPRLHGMNWNPSMHVKNRSATKDEMGEKETTLGSSMRDLLSEGWGGITNFSETDNLPIGSDSVDGTQNILALSIQLVSSVPISHACFVELYMAEMNFEENDVTGEDIFEEHPLSRPRGSISFIIQSGLIREGLRQSKSQYGSLRNRMSSDRRLSIGAQFQGMNASQWVRVGFTETVLPTLVPGSVSGEPTAQIATFLSVLQTPVMTTNPILRFVVYELPEDASSPTIDRNTQSNAMFARMSSVQLDERAKDARVSGLGLAPPSRRKVFCEFTCSANEIQTSEELTLVAGEGSHRTASFGVVVSDIVDPSLITTDSAPHLMIKSMTVATRTLKENNGFYITKSFQFAEGNDMVIEDMTESVFTNEIPRQYLEILRNERADDLAHAKADLADFDAKCKSGLLGGLCDNLIDQIQGENDQAVVLKWLEDRVQRRRLYVDSLRECHQTCIDRAEAGINFKASTDKKVLALRFLPINLHVQDMWIGPTSQLGSQRSRRTSSAVMGYPTITVGAFAAHCYKFRHGGSILSLRSKLQKRSLSRIRSDISESANGDDVDWTDTEIRSRDELKWQLTTRLDMCISQALTALVTSFCRTLEQAIQHPFDHQFLQLIDAIGFLFQVESLLSTQGKEIGMLEDFSASVDALKHVSFILDTSPPSYLPSTLNLHMKNTTLPSVVSVRLSKDARDSQAFTVVVGVRCQEETLSIIPARLKAGGKISVTPVIFTQGINEMQTLANNASGKKTTLQHTINRKSFHSLSAYMENYKKLAATRPDAVPTDVATIIPLLASLEERIAAAGKQVVKTKHPKIIQESSRLCRLLGAGRVTSCKSAKDRTSMSVTLEQTQLLCDRHGLPQEYLIRTVSTMRSNGVRLENAYKNTGKRQYAFNALQRSLLPEEYKCPEGTYGRGNVS